MEKNNKHNENKVNFTFSNEVAMGNYSNIVLIANSKSEFIFDFSSILPGIEVPEIFNRIIMSPLHAKRFLLHLQENIKEYEAMFGSISVEEDEIPIRPINPLNQEVLDLEGSEIDDLNREFMHKRKTKS